MASYRGRLDVLNRPYRGVLVALYNTNGVKIDVETSDRYGFYRFTGLATGSYTVKFRGRNYSNQDDIDITVVDSFDSDALVPLTFFTPPTLGVSEGDPYVSAQGEGSEAILALSNLQAETGILGWVDVWCQKTTSPS
jgi:hypothetical protein